MKYNEVEKFLIWWGVMQENDFSSDENMTFIELLRTLHFRLGKKSHIVKDKSRNCICEEIWS